MVLVDSNKEIADGASEDYRRTYQKDVQSALNISGQVALTGMTTYESAFWLATEISGKITGNGGLKFSGTANALWGKNAYLVLSNSENDFQGGITINRTDGVGIVRVTNGGALGSGAVNIEDTDDILSYRGTVGESFDTISNKIEGYGSIYIDSGKVAMRGDNSAFSGNISVNAGALAAGSASALGTGAVTVADGATLQISVQNVDAGTISLTGNARIVVDLADFKTALDSTDVLTILTDTALTFNGVSMLAGTLTNEQLSPYMSVIDSSGSFESYVNQATWAYDGSNLTLTIPEPSAFGWLAGVGALALCVSRRRRVKKA